MLEKYIIELGLDKYVDKVSFLFEDLIMNVSIVEIGVCLFLANSFARELLKEKKEEGKGEEIVS